MDIKEKLCSNTWDGEEIAENIKNNPEDSMVEWVPLNYALSKVDEIISIIERIPIKENIIKKIRGWLNDRVI